MSTEIEIVAIERDDGGIHVMHAMELRERYRPWYEEAMQWHG